MDQHVEVIKLGGSLLNLKNLSEHLRRWTEFQPPCLRFWVVGGGQLVEAMRELDATHHFDAQWMHWHCVDLLSSTARTLNQLLPDFGYIAKQEELAAALHCLSSQNYIVAPGCFYSAESSSDLPNDWTTTTDSIAALLALTIEARKLVLLKSAAPPASTHNSTFRDWSEKGFTDEAFPGIAQHLSCVEALNFRDWAQNHYNSSNCA